MINDQIVKNTLERYPDLDSSYLERVLLQIQHKGFIDPVDIHQMLKAWSGV